MINRVVLVGRLTKGIELKKTASGKSVATFTLAVTKNKDKTNFITCVAWERVADILNQYTQKGSQIAVEGSLEQREYEYQGAKRSVLEVLVSSVELTGNRQQAQEEPEEEIIYNRPISIDDSDLPV